MPSPSSRRERPAKPALTRDGIVSVAAEIMRAEGLQKVTMRRLATELDTGPASLYVYIANTAELHAAILDDVLGTVDLVSAGGSWDIRLEAVITAFTAALFENPGLARSALVARPSGDNYLRLVDRILALLDGGGVDPERAAWGVDLLLQFATATAAEQATRDESSDAEADWEALTSALGDPSRPHIANVAAQLISGTPQQRLSWGIRVLINGIPYTQTAPERSGS